MIEIEQQIEKVIDQYVKYFKKKNQISKISEVEKILSSSRYNVFLDNIFYHYNSQVDMQEKCRLDPKVYKRAEKAIDEFWERLLGSEIKKEFESELISKCLSCKIRKD